MKPKILCILLFIFAFSHYSTYSQEGTHQLSLSPFHATELGFGVGAGYKYDVTNKLELAIPISLNWNLSSLLYGPSVTDMYKSKSLRIMPNIKYKAIQLEKFRYSVGLGMSYGHGWDELKDDNYIGTYAQWGALIDNSLVVLNSTQNVGVGLDVGLGIHFHSTIAEKYRSKYDFSDERLLRIGLKLIYLF